MYEYILGIPLKGFMCISIVQLEWGTNRLCKRFKIFDNLTSEKYCTAYNDSASEEIPRSSDVTEYMKHSEEVVKNMDIMYEHSDFEGFAIEDWGEPYKEGHYG